ncbi:hypothetical protein [Streptomyces hoynatensis]|nr:hypothetical protein [Streptomyces hoynatensis]
MWAQTWWLLAAAVAGLALMRLGLDATWRDRRLTRRAARRLRGGRR